MNDEALEVVKRVLVAHDEAPLEDMERLVDLAREDAAFRLELLSGASEVLRADPASLVPCWLALVAGELGPPGAELLLSTLGTSDEDALDETIVPVLTRHATSLYPAITKAIDEAPAEEREFRAALYDALAGVVMGDDVELKTRLRAFALRRFEDEESLPPDLSLATEVGMLLEALRRPSPDEDARLTTAARILGQSWKDTARDIADRFGRASAAR